VLTFLCSGWSKLEEWSMALQIGSTLNNRYRIAALLGQGGFGAVYRAWDVNLNRPCAVKENLDSSAEAQRQFQREAEMLSGLRHPNLPVVSDHFFVPGVGQYLVMDYIEGEDLAQMVERVGPLKEAEAINWLSQVCDALDYLHNQKPPVIHRDVKPANIKITPQGKAILVDFGLAKVHDPHLRTTVGARAVTPGYAPPEQYGRGRTDGRSDIYALGATLYTVLTGQEPPDAVDLMVGNETLRPPGQLRPGISSYVAEAAVKAMQSQPTNRYESAAAFRQALAIRPPKSPPTPPFPVAKATPTNIPTWQWLIPAAVVLIIVVGANWNNARTPVVETVIMEVTRVQIAEVTAERPTVTPSPTPDVSIPPLNASLGATWLRPADGMVMVYVPPGTFQMGSNASEPDAFEREFPRHSVTLTEGFWIDQTEVTNEQYGRCVTAGACAESDYADNISDSSADLPVVGVSWYDGEDYCAWVGGGLPTEAQWEYAARGPEEHNYPWGDVLDGERLNFCDTNCPYDWQDADWDDDYTLIAPVGSYPVGASWVGALDMTGNVSEWAADWYAGNYYAVSPEVDPAGPATGMSKVLRGGSWVDTAALVRAASRISSPPDTRHNIFGFRCAAGPGV
jgi:formylglycine-generating enzyme required for sulfatase activity